MVGGEEIRNKMQLLLIRDRVLVPLYYIKWNIKRMLGYDLKYSNQILDMKLRRSMFEAVGDKSLLPGISVKLELLKSGDNESLNCYVFEPIDWDTVSTMFYYHGGGWCVGSVGNTHFQFIQNLALKLKMRIISPEYRLAPEHPFPAGFNDCYESTKHFVKTLDLKKYHFTGDSAGGNLCTAVCLKLAITEPALMKSNRPGLLAPIYPSYLMDFNQGSFVTEDLPTLSRRSTAKYLSTYLTGSFDEGILKDICSNYHFESEWNPKPNIANIDPAKVMKFSSNKFAVKKLKKGLENPYFQCLIASDENLKKMLECLSVGVHMVAMEHDVIRDDSFLMATRLKLLNQEVHLRRPLSQKFEDDKVSVDVVTGGWHGLFSVKFVVENKELDAVVNNWFEDISRMVETGKLDRKKLDFTKKLCRKQHVLNLRNTEFCPYEKIPSALDEGIPFPASNLEELLEGTIPKSELNEMVKNSKARR